MSQQPIIIKKVVKKGGGHGSTSWKIALADFMTALMIVFFVLWVTASTEETTAQGISEYFSGKSAFTLEGHETDINQLREMFKDIRQQAEDKNIELSYVEEFNIIKAEFESDSLFETGSAVLAPKARVALQSFSESIRHAKAADGSNLYYHIYGYADNIPLVHGADYRNNLELSTHRAMAVSRYLVDQGLSPNEMTLHGEGSLNPVASNNTPSGRSQNRRVEIYISLSPFPTRAYDGFSTEQTSEDSSDATAEPEATLVGAEVRMENSLMTGHA